MIDFDEIRKEVAIKHGFVLDKDDPVLVTVTLNDLMLRRHVETLNAQNEAHKKAMSEVLQKTLAEAKLSAGRIVTDGSRSATEQCKGAIAEAMDHAIRKATEDIRSELVRSKKAIWATKSAGFLNGWLAASLSTLALVVLLKVFS